MKPSAIPTLLLGLAAGSVTALNQTVAINQTAAITLAALSDWPKVQVMPTYHRFFDDEKIQQAAECLASWCESDQYIRKKGGKIRCRSSGDEGAEVFICNAYEKQRCSAQNIAQALIEMRGAGTTTGAVLYETAEGSGFIYGFEYFCKGTAGSKCGERYDAVDAHCNREKTRWSRHKLQYDGVAKKRRVEDFSYLGTSWMEKPTPMPKAQAHGWSTLRTATGANNVAPEPTPTQGPNNGAPNAAAFTQVAHAYASRVKPQPTAQAPASIAIFPGPTGVPKA